MDAPVEAQLAPSRALAEFAANLRYDDIPPHVRDLAKLLILDALGCGLAATGYDFAKATFAGAQALGGEGPCAVIGSATRLPLRDAALVNGVLLHGLDFDDSNFLGILHPTVACLPAALGVGQMQGTSSHRIIVPRQVPNRRFRNPQIGSQSPACVPKAAP